KNYALFATATISSVEKTAFSKNNHTPVLARNFRITIQNQDNPALQIKDIEVNYLADRLIFQAEKEKEYYLFYGNSNSRKPLYDIERFKENIIALQTFDEAALGNEIVLDNSQKQALPLFQNKLWLWAVMLIVILILGFFSYKMISKK